MKTKNINQFGFYNFPQQIFGKRAVLIQITVFRCIVQNKLESVFFGNLPPVPSDIASSDYHLFPSMEHYIKNK